LSRGTNSNKSYDFIFGEIRKPNVFIGHSWSVYNIGIYQVLDFAIIKKIYPYNAVVFIFDTYNNKGIVIWIGVCQCANMLDKFCLALLVANIDKPFLVIKTIFIIMSKQIFN